MSATLTVVLVGAVVGLLGAFAISWFLDLSSTLPLRPDDEPSADFDQHAAEAIALVAIVTDGFGGAYCIDEEDAIARSRRMLAGT